MSTTINAAPCGCQFAEVFGPSGVGPNGEDWHMNPTAPGWCRTGRNTYARLCDGHLEQAHSAMFPSDDSAAVSVPLTGTDAMSLNEVLAALGYTTGPGRLQYAHTILRDGVEVFHGRAGDVWAWLRESGQIADEVQP